MVLPAIERHGPIAAWIVDDTGFPTLAGPLQRSALISSTGETTRSSDHLSNDVISAGLIRQVYDIATFLIRPNSRFGRLAMRQESSSWETIFA
jgi:hypothetical protein